MRANEFASRGAEDGAAKSAAADWEHSPPGRRRPASRALRPEKRMHSPQASLERALKRKEILGREGGTEGRRGAAEES